MDKFRKLKTKLKSKKEKSTSTKTLNLQPTGFSQILKLKENLNKEDFNITTTNETFDNPIFNKTKEYNPIYNVSYELPKNLVQNEFILPNVGDDFNKSLDLNQINKELIALKSNVFIAEDLIRKFQHDIDDDEIKNINKIIKTVMYVASQVHHAIMYVQISREIEEDETDMYDYLGKELTYQIMKISNMKQQFTMSQNKFFSDKMKIIKPDMTNEEINNMLHNSQYTLDNPEDDETCMMFAKQIVADKYKREEANLALQFAMEQKKELLEIEKSIAQLHQMSIDLQQLICGHSEMIDKLEENILNAVKYSGKGLQMLQTAEANKIASRKKKIITGVIIAVVAGVAVITIVGIAVGVMCFVG